MDFSAQDKSLIELIILMKFSNCLILIYKSYCYTYLSDKYNYSYLILNLMMGNDESFKI